MNKQRHHGVLTLPDLALIEMMILQHLPDWYYSFFYFPKHFNRQCHYVLHKHCTIQCVLHYQVNILQILQEHQRLSCLFIVALSSEPPSDFVTASKTILFVYFCLRKFILIQDLSVDISLHIVLYQHHICFFTLEFMKLFYLLQFHPC